MKLNLFKCSRCQREAVAGNDRPACTKCAGELGIRKSDGSIDTRSALDAGCLMEFVKPYKVTDQDANNVAEGLTGAIEKYGLAWRRGIVGMRS